MTDPHPTPSLSNPSDSSSTSDPLPADIHSLPPPATVPDPGIVFTSTRSSPRRLSSPPRLKQVDAQLRRSSTPEAAPAAMQRRVPRTAPAPRVDPGALRVLQWTWLVVGGVGLMCALGGVLFFQLSKDEEALRKGRAARRKRWGYLEHTFGGHHSDEEEERQAELEQQRRREKERQRLQQQAQTQDKASQQSAWWKKLS